MQKRTIEVIVGLFILSGLAALLMLALKVSGLVGMDMFREKEGYHITADFDNVGGLKVRSRVALAGVPVGRVVHIELDQQNFIAKVTLVIDKHIDHIPTDSRFSILTAGLLGDNYLGITPGFSDSFLHEGGHVGISSTDSALILEQLLSRFLAGQASK